MEGGHLAAYFVDIWPPYLWNLATRRESARVDLTVLAQVAGGITLLAGAVATPSPHHRVVQADSIRERIDGKADWW